jgi:hypothetical protein
MRAFLAASGLNPYFAKEYIDRYLGYIMVKVSFGPGLVTFRRREGPEPDPEEYLEPETGEEPGLIGRPALSWAKIDQKLRRV